MIKRLLISCLLLTGLAACEKEVDMSKLPGSDLYGYQIRDIISSDNTGSNWFSDKDINKWSFRKPVRSSKITLAEQDYLDVNYGFDIPYFSAGTIDELDNIYAYFEGSNIPDWGYLRPRGQNYNEAYRAGDFRLYDHSAINPFIIRTVESSVVSGDEFHILCDFDFSSLLDWGKWRQYKNQIDANLPKLFLYSGRMFHELTSSKRTIKNIKNLNNYNIPTSGNTSGVKDFIGLVMIHPGIDVSSVENTWFSFGQLKPFHPVFLDVFPTRFSITLSKPPTFEESVTVGGNLTGIGNERNLGGTTFINITSIRGTVTFRNTSNRKVTINGGSVTTRSYDLANPTKFQQITLVSFGSFTIQPNNSYGVDIDYRTSFYYKGYKDNYSVNYSANGSVEGGGSGMLSGSLKVTFT